MLSFTNCRFYVQQKQTFSELTNFYCEENTRKEKGWERIETDEDRTYFLIEIPCREDFKTINEPQNEPQNETRLTVRQTKIVDLLKEEPSISKAHMAEKIGVSWMTVKRDIGKLVDLGLIRYVGPSRGGHWELTE